MCFRLCILVSWLLLIPPAQELKPGQVVERRLFDASRPISEWIRVGEFNTPLECESFRSQTMMATSLAGNKAVAEQFNAGVCVSN